jgi:hypothetical protein
MRKRNKLKYVKTWVRNLIYNHDLNFHPDTPIADYVSQNGEAVFANPQILQKQLERNLKICKSNKTDIYQFTLPIFKAFLKANRI